MTRHRAWTERVDAGGRVQLVTSPCVTFVSFHLAPCEAGERAAYSRVEAGRRAVFGTAPLWGGSWTDGEVREVALEGPVLSGSDRLRLHERDGCAHAEAEPPVRTHAVQFVPGLGSAPRRLVICPGESFPREVVMADWTALTSKHVDAKDPGRPPGGTWRKAAPETSARQEPASRPSVAAVDDPTFPTSEALDAIRKDPRVAEFLRDASWWGIRGSTVDHRSTETPGEQRVTDDATRVATLERPHGETLRVAATRTRLVDRCAIEVGEAERGPDTPSLQGDSVLTMDVKSIRPTAKAVLGAEGRRSWGTIFQDPDDPDIPTSGHLVHRFLVLDTRSFIPFWLHIDGATGEALFCHCPQAGFDRLIAPTRP